MSMNVFLPCRKGSERVVRKNIKPISIYDYGLIEIKLRQLLSAKKIEKIFLSTNDDEILDYAKNIDDRIILHKRSEKLSSNETSTDDLILHAKNLIGKGDILWTHVTSPFLNGSDYDSMIDSYYNAINDGHDSLMTVVPVRGFIWRDGSPINYDRLIEKWPRTQTIRPMFEVSNGGFIANIENYENLQDRVGDKIYLYSLDKIKSMDVDWEDDFKLVELIINSNPHFL